MARRPLRSNGVEVIGWREYASLLDDSLKKQVVYVPGVMRYGVLRLLDRFVDRETPALLVPPETDWVLAAREVAERKLTCHWFLHSERTWQFATALAARDHQRAAANGKPTPEVDPELLYVAALLHDTGLLSDDRKRCFAVVGATNALSTARKVGADRASAKLVAQAICSHISVNPGNQLGEYVQAGSLLDLIGSRAWHLGPALVKKVCDEWPRAGFPAELRTRWARESSLFPHGRAAFARWPGGLSLATYVAPLPRKPPRRQSVDEES